MLKILEINKLPMIMFKIKMKATFNISNFGYFPNRSVRAVNLKIILRKNFEFNVNDIKKVESAI